MKFVIEIDLDGAVPPTFNGTMKQVIDMVRAISSHSIPARADLHAFFERQSAQNPGITQVVLAETLEDNAPVDGRPLARMFVTNEAFDPTNLGVAQARRNELSTMLIMQNGEQRTEKV